MFIFTIPVIAWLAMIITSVLLVNLGVDKKTIDTIGIFVVYVQITTILVLLRWLKGKVIQ